MRRINIDREWNFVEGKLSDIPGMEKPVRTVNLPHDFMIETNPDKESPGGSLTGYYCGGTGTYTKMLDIVEDIRGKRFILEFDGSYMNTTVIMNGHLAGRHHYGYTPFHVDISPYLKPGQSNRLSVTVNNQAQPNSRWYTGSGLYRHVDLLVSPKLHIAPWGIYAHTSHIVNGIAFVIVETTVENHTEEAAECWVQVQLKKDSSGNGESKETAVSEGRIKVHAAAGGKATARMQVLVEDAELWDVDSPNLYVIEALLTNCEQVLDKEQTLFGIRTIHADSKNGFMLNGRSLKLKGGCVHHDNGILGAVSLYDSEFRRMKLHKDNGYNGIRFSHNPMSGDLLEACDRLGLLVIDEAFDVWTMEKNTCDYSLYFESDWEMDLESILLRDRNHPCVIMWSIGNEIPERGKLSGGAEWAARLADKVRKLDAGRLVTSSLCSFFNGLEDDDRKKFWQSLYEEAQKGAGAGINMDNAFGRSIWNDYTESYASVLDVVGYNYLNYHYGEAVTRFPGRIICGTESKPREMEVYWADVEKYSHVIGDFTWTSYDYLGEAGIGKQLYVSQEDEKSAAKSLYNHKYPWRTANDADFDICGFERPQLAFRRIIWGSEETFLVSHNPEHFDWVELLGRWGWPDCDHIWTWPGKEGSRVKVEVYSAAEEVELLLNGRSVGKEGAGKENNYKASFVVEYEPGVLKAVSFTNGKKVSEDELQTVGRPAAVSITVDKPSLKADGQSLCFGVIEVVDEDGRRVPFVEQLAIAKVEGAAVLAGFGTGCPVTEENYTVGKFTFYKGRLLAVVRSGYDTGEAVLSVEMDGFEKASVLITVIK